MTYFDKFKSGAMPFVWAILVITVIIVVARVLGSIGLMPLPLYALIATIGTFAAAVANSLNLFQGVIAGGYVAGGALHAVIAALVGGFVLSNGFPLLMPLMSPV